LNLLVGTVITGACTWKIYLVPLLVTFSDEFRYIAMCSYGYLCHFSYNSYISVLEYSIHFAFFSVHTKSKIKCEKCWLYCSYSYAKRILNSKLVMHNYSIKSICGDAVLPWSWSYYNIQKTCQISRAINTKSILTCYHFLSTLSRLQLQFIFLMLLPKKLLIMGFYLQKYPAGVKVLSLSFLTIHIISE